MERLVSLLMAQVDVIQPTGALRLMGYSWGALVGLEAAKYAHAHGRRVEALLLLEPFERLPRRMRLLGRWLPRFTRSLECFVTVPAWVRELHSLAQQRKIAGLPSPAEREKERFT